MYKTAIWCGLAVILTACGGGGGGGSAGAGIDPRLARLDIYATQQLRVLGDVGAGVMGMPLTLPENVPHMGAMAYEGSASIRVEDGTRPLVLFGDATITIDFDQGAATGALTDFFGNTQGGAVVDYSGTIDISSASATQDLVFDYAGTLSGGAEALRLAGQLQGTFLGSAATALVGADLEAQVNHNGQPKTATLVLISERVPPP